MIVISQDMVQDRVHTEIGSEFWDVPTGDKNSQIVPEDAEWFISGRSALSGILADITRSRRVRTAALPSWCCESMATPFRAKGIDVSYYSVTYENGQIKQALSSSTHCDLILVMGYFGMSDTPRVPSSFDGVVVEDLTHSIFSSRVMENADYRFGSLRKWCGLATGGFAWSTTEKMQVSKEAADNRYIGLRNEAMKAKASYIGGKSLSKGYLETFAQAEGWLDTNTVPMEADRRDVDAARFLDEVAIRKVRRENAEYLIDRLGKVSSVDLLFKNVREGDCPLFVPIIASRRDSLRQYLIDNEVYCPVHWPNSVSRPLSVNESVLYNNGMSLVCDQRYGIDDMQRIVELIMKWQKTN